MSKRDHDQCESPKEMVSTGVTRSADSMVLETRHGPFYHEDSETSAKSHINPEDPSLSTPIFLDHDRYKAAQDVSRREPPPSFKKLLESVAAHHASRCDLQKPTHRFLFYDDETETRTEFPFRVSEAAAKELATKSQELEVKDVQLVGAWRFRHTNGDCGICMDSLMEPCAICATDEGTDPGLTCTVVHGECDHAYHLHCLQKWNRESCPLCLRKFNINYETQPYPGPPEGCELKTMVEVTEP